MSRPARLHATLRLPRGPASACAAALVAALALAGCGGGGNGEASAEATASGTRAVQVAATPASPWTPPDLSPPADAAQKGAWSRVYDWPHVAVHTALMPDGRVVTYGAQPNGSQGGRFQYDIWEGTGAPDQGHQTLPNTVQTEIFCSTQIVLPGTQDLFIGGGDNWTGAAVDNTGNATTTLIRGADSSITRQADMRRPRWYASATTMINGDIFIQGGLGGTDRPEIRRADGSFRLQEHLDTSDLQFWYPNNFVLSDGRIFGFDGLGKMYYLDPNAESRTDVGQLPGANIGNDTSSAMFRPGRILQIGGNSNGALVIDVTAGGTPTVTPTQSLSSRRRLVSATLLPDGQVLATGGSDVWNTLQGVNNAAEIWNPETGQWTVGQAGQLARLYHSGALLLPDASVLVVGGGADSPVSSLPLNNKNVEIYYPPYLFDANGQFAPRPTLQAAPMSLEIGRIFQLTVGANDSIRRVTLVKTGSTTHSRNMDQRFIELAFSAQGSQLTVQAPARAGDATPGYYLLYVINAQGVPSVASMVSIGVAADPNPSTTPTLQRPADPSSVVGASVQLALIGRDPNGDTLSYLATGLPPGLTLDAATGLISGTPTEAGSYAVEATVTDGSNVGSTHFNWTVAHADALYLQSLPVPAATVTQGSVNFDATVSGGADPQYRWDFGDGSEPSAWSASPQATHVYARPGIFSVTFSARDARGEQITRSFLQTVHLPAQGQPVASGQIVLDADGSRAWVVNPDNDSLSLFDLSATTRLAEIPVGSGPRTVSRDRLGRLWVANKNDATLSVIDPGTRTVVRTLALPRASQPHGIVASPQADLAYVALEATGQVLRIDTAAVAITGSLDVGAAPRQLSLKGDGTALYVSRFISPPLPGEGTTRIEPSSSTGGEVLKIDTATWRVDKTIVLHLSEVPDGQNSGRGLPNYLGAAVISPDGSQAWVPHKVDNVQRGGLRDGLPLNFQNSVRAAAARIDLGTDTDDLARRFDLDNASMAGAAAYDPTGVYLFVALETSREVVVMSAHEAREILRIDVGRTPQGLAVTPDGQTLVVHNFMDRTLSLHDLRPLVRDGLASVPLRATLNTITQDKLGAQLLRGKQLFHDARDPRLSRDNYLSCASCHDEGGQDGRVWDFSNFGEGLRNTISLRGRASAQGRLHWSGNFDEVQDFEGQIRAMAGGTGLMSNADFNAGTRADPLGDPKAGRSADLDALAAYVGSLKKADPSPYRAADGSLTSSGQTGRTVFAARCASCHGGSGFTDSPLQVLRDVGTLRASSGHRLGGALNGIDTPTLRDVWATAPYLHDGSAPSLEAAIAAHVQGLGATDMSAVVDYLRQIGREETAAPSPSSANLVVRATGASVSHVGPVMTVRVAGVNVGRVQLDSPYNQDVSFDLPFLPAGAPVDLIFDNDGRLGAADRSLAIGLIQIDGVASLRSTDAGVTIDRGTGADAFDGSDTVTGASTGGVLAVDGALRFQVPAGITPPGTGTETYTVRAKATLAGGLGAAMSLRVDGQVVATRTVDSLTEQDYTLQGPPLHGGSRVDVVFTNDAVIGTENRNLFLRSVRVGPYTLAPTDAGAYIDKGEGSTAFDGQDIVSSTIYGGWIPWNAAMRLTVPTSPDLIVRARGALAGGQGPHMNVVVNGKQLGSFDVNTTSNQDFTVPDVPLRPGDRIDVVFTNDAVIGSENRNLFVANLGWGGTTMRPGDAGSLIDKGEGSAAFDGVDTVSATIYGGWVPWNAAMRLTVPEAPKVPTPDTVTVRAAARMAGDVGAEIALRVNGVLFETRRVDAAAVQAYSFASPTIATGDKLEIVYLNDEIVGGVDRNVYIESVLAGGRTLRPSDSGAVIDVGDGAAAFDGLDLRAANVYGGWVPWNGAMRWTVPTAAPTGP